MARRMGLLSGFALTKYCVDVSNMLAESEIIQIDSLSVHSKERQFFVEFCKQCWKAEQTVEAAAGFYLGGWYANNMRYLDGSPDSNMTLVGDGEAIVMSNVMLQHMERQKRAQKGD